ncbi:MAG: PAS domain S-box protein [Fidelibacterota bacterium]
MKHFKDISIKNKLISIILSIVSLMLIIGFTVLVYFSLDLLSSAKTAEAESLAKIIGDYSIAALTFNYPERGNEILNKLDNNPNVIACFIYDDDMELFAAHIYGDQTKMDAPDITGGLEFKFFKGDNYHILRKINYNNNNYGWIYLIINSHIISTTLLIIVIFTVLLLTLIFVSYLMANRLQRFISEPVVELAQTARQIGQSGKYSIRIPRKQKDEIGQLYNEFNKMLSVIEKREIEKNAAREKVKENERWINTIINNLNDSVVVHDLHTGKIIYVNDTACKMYGYDRDEMKQRNIADLSTNDSVFNQNTALEKMKKCLKEGPQVFQWHALKKDHTEFWVEVNMRKAILNNKERVMVVVRNIEDQKKKQQEINNLQKYLIDIVDSMPSIIIGTDENIRITQWNRKAQSFTNLSVDDVLGQNLSAIESPLPENLAAQIKGSIANDKVIIDEKVKLWVNNHRYYFTVTIYPLSSDGSNGAVIRLDDTTEKVRMEELMIQSEKMLSIGGLAAGMAHEINNPLAGMMQNAAVVLNRLTKHSAINESVANECGTTMSAISQFMSQRRIIKQLRLISDSGQRASEIISNMLSFARKSESKFDDVQLSKVLDLSIELAKNDYDLKKKYDFRKIKIQRDYQDNLPDCYCDRRKMEQVFLNILKNGAHAMSTVKDRPSLFNIKIAMNDTHFIITVADNGPGIPAESRKRIFEPFYTTKDVGEGTGLGLSVSYFIITENHHGQMYVESELNKGTRFIIKLPV